MIREIFIETASRYTTPEQATLLWEELEACYHESGRHYHTLTHLDSVLTELIPHREAFLNFDTLVFAVAYHDAVYNALKSNNEEKSAVLATKRLTEINFPEIERSRCAEFILATKKHLPADEETNLFTDADLSILGADPETYLVYTQQIRKEYSMYPDFLYNPGRKKVLQHFLSMNSIYKTESFLIRYEAKAKANLETELHTLQR